MQTRTVNTKTITVIVPLSALAQMTAKATTTTTATTMTKVERCCHMVLLSRVVETETPSLGGYRSEKEIHSLSIKGPQSSSIAGNR